MSAGNRKTLPPYRGVGRISRRAGQERDGEPTLTAEDTAAIVVLRRQGFDAATIAVTLTLAAQDVEVVVAELEAPDTREEAKRILSGAAAHFARRVVAEADAAESLEVLDRLDVANKKRETTGAGGVTVIVGGDAQVQVNAGPVESADIDRVMT